MKNTTNIKNEEKVLNREAKISVSLNQLLISFETRNAY